MPGYTNEILTTGSLMNEIRTDHVFKLPEDEGKALVTKVNLGQLNDFESLNLQQDDSTAFYQDKRDVRVRVPAISRISKVSEGALTAVMQIWEGTVISIDESKQYMSVKLIDRAGLIPAHTADVDLEWVAQQDVDLVKPGAIFYWTIYKETKRGTVKNSEELQFRRLPYWTKKQVEQLYKDADSLLAKFAS